MAIPNWMTKTWHITTTNESGVAMSDSVSFDTTTDPSTIKVMVQSTPWGSLDPDLIAAADTSVAGSTYPSANPPGQPFNIQYTGTTLNCYLDNASYQRPFFSQRHWLAVGLGIGVGTLLGGAVGFAAGPLLLGAMAGLVGATAGSLVTVARGIADPDQGQGGSSRPDWVAGDPTGKIIIKQGPQPVVRATA